MRLTITAGDDETITSTDEAFVHQMEMALNLYKRKSVAYGHAWREQGYMGQVARILSKSSRLKNMMWRPFQEQNSDETTEDTVRDLINLCIFFLLNRGQENAWGRDIHDR